jgi:hypothetical protein
VGRAIDAKGSRNSSAGVCLDSQQCENCSVESVAVITSLPNTTTNLEFHTQGRRRCH